MILIPLQVVGLGRHGFGGQYPCRQGKKVGDGRAQRLKDMLIHVAQGNQTQKRTECHILRPCFSREAAGLTIFKALSHIS